jgi:biopolymer transport protein ExbD
MFRLQHLIFVSLALLISFQVASRLGLAQEPGPPEPRRVPAMETAQASPPPLLVVLQTTADGSLGELTVREGDDEVTIKTLKALARYLRRTRLDKDSLCVVELQVNPRTKFSIVTGVVDTCAKAGYQKIHFATSLLPQTKP